MKKIILLLFFIPLFGQSQEIHKSTKSYWDTKLKTSVCCDSVTYVNGWLDAGDNDKADTRYPYLQFTISNSKREGIYIKFYGQFKGTQYTSTSEIDSVEIQFENHEKIKLVSRENNISTAIPPRMLTGTDNNVFLNKMNIDKLKANSIYKVSFFSSKKAKPNIQGEVIVKTKYKDDIKNCIRKLLE